MGLCKCPKRQVTNQFCFEHRVNVCENCMVTSHPKCIVQSYLQWLKDSDYVSTCPLCGITLEDGDCIRLICYHVFHWACINERQSSLPINTAPGGHTCPTCANPIFPPANLVSPVADVLKHRLGQVNWGRNELGLPLLSEDKMEQIKSIQSSEFNQMTKIHHSNSDKNKLNGVFYNNNEIASSSPHSVLLMDSFNPPSSDFHSNRRPLLPRQSPIGGTDRDDNKYRRRTPAEIFSRWSRRFYAPSSRPPWKRTWFLVLSGLFIFILMIYLMASFGRSGDSSSLEMREWKDSDHY